LPDLSSFCTSLDQPPFLPTRACRMPTAERFRFPSLTNHHEDDAVGMTADCRQRSKLHWDETDVQKTFVQISEILPWVRDVASRCRFTSHYDPHGVYYVAPNLISVNHKFDAHGARRFPSRIPGPLLAHSCQMPPSSPSSGALMIDPKPVLCSLANRASLGGCELTSKSGRQRGVSASGLSADRSGGDPHQPLRPTP